MENEFIDWLKMTFAEQTRTSPGIGDDAAVFSTIDEMQQLATSDCLVEGVHFQLASTSLDLVGRKCVASSISDIAAMCGSPAYVIVSIVAPKTFCLDDLKQLYQGMAFISDAYDCAIVGGDFVTHDGPLTINITLLGHAKHNNIRFRFGSRLGDRIFVSGALGGSSSGHHLTFEPRIELGLILGSDPQVHAVTDITDGLVIDLFSLLSSDGFGATLIKADIPLSKHLPHNNAAIQAALYDGEDFELLFTASSDYAGHLQTQASPVPITQIGYVTQNGEFLLAQETGEITQLDIYGYSH
jgi:thiamine-monophosphate kinase